jgi:uncharacterized protein with PQ loop repeat
VTLHTLALSLAYLGAALGVTMVVPQIVRTVRHPTLSGVSPSAWALTALACTTWLVYGVRTATVPQIPGNVLLVSGAVAVVLLVPSATSRRRRAAQLGAAWTALVVVASAVPAHAVGYLAFCVGLVAAWPQVYDSVLGRRSSTASGVSVTTWSIKVVSQACWLAYALLTADLPVAISATVAFAAAALVVSVESSRRVLAQRSTPAPVLELEPA